MVSVDTTWPHQIPRGYSPRVIHHEQGAKKGTGFLTLLSASHACYLESKDQNSLKLEVKTKIPKNNPKTGE
jgi:hypothetical protein